MDSVTSALMQEFSIANSTDNLADDKKFEHFAAYSVVSSRYADEFNTDDIVSGAGQDLNVDAFAVIVNGKLANDADYIDDIVSSSGIIDVEFIVIQAKTSSSFDGAQIIALGDNLKNEIFSEERQLDANDDIKRLIEIKDRILQYAPRLRDNPICRIYYVCTGNWTDDTYLKSIIERKREELIQTNLFSDIIFYPIGARQIQQMYRDTKTSISKEIRFDRLINLPDITDVSASYLGILPITEYFKLIEDDNGKIISSIFIDNVRDFQGENIVNKDIDKTITDRLFDQFLLRNNGITIVARSVKATSSKYLIEDYQVVNGCQTSHVLHSNKNEISGDLFISLKLIHTEDDAVSQSIIKSTNSQTQIAESDLLALTKFQRDLEDFFNAKTGDYKLYYERRAKQYNNRSDIEKTRITTIGSQLKSYSSMFIELPNQAGRYQGTLLKSVKDRIFQLNHKPEPYYVSAFTFYRFEVAIRRLTGSDREIKPFKFYLLLAFRYRYESEGFPGASNRKVVKYSAKLLEKISDQQKSKAAFDECCLIVQAALANLGLEFERDNAKSAPLVDEVKKVALLRKPAAPIADNAAS